MTNATNVKNDKALLSLETLIADTIQHWTKARDGVQKSLVGVLSYVHLTKSQEHAARLVNTLLDGLGDGINGNAIREWCGFHLNMVLNKENKMSCKKFDIKAFPATKDAKLWYTYKVQKPVMFDLDAQIVALLKKAETNAAKSKEDLVDGSVINVSADAMKALKSIAKDAETRVSAKKAKEIAA
jgi:hypothetical protein